MGVTDLFSLFTVIFIIIFVIGFLFIFRRSNDITSSTLVLRKFQIDSSLNNEIIIELAGRPSGLISWILTLIKLDDETTLIIKKDEIYYSGSSLYGEFYDSVPLTNISSTHCGYTKPLRLIFSGIFFIIIGVFLKAELGVLLILIGLCFIISYWLLKCIIITIVTIGGTMLSIKFKRSIIENVSIDFEKGIQTIKTLNLLILKNLK